MPRSTATVSVVVKDRTSTTTATSAPSAIASAPVGPQSNLTRCAGLTMRRVELGGHRTRTTDLPRVRRSSMSRSALPKSSRSYVVPIGGLTKPASIIGTSSAHCCCM